MFFCKARVKISKLAAAQPAQIHVPWRSQPFFLSIFAGQIQDSEALEQQIFCTERPWASMKCFVTGASGFIGANLVRELLAEGHSVKALLRPGSDTRGLVGLDFERVQGD